MSKILPYAWLAGDRYEPFVGRWSRLVARRFIEWLYCVPGLDWLDVGCGTGALSDAIFEGAEPRAVVGLDPSETFVGHARVHVADGRASFEIGQAHVIPFGTGFFDIAASGLALNFVPDQTAALREMRRVVKHGGIVALYVWDYADGMEMLRYFWDGAIAEDPDAAHFDEGKRFPICDPDRLRALFKEVGFQDVDVCAIDVATAFRDFDDYWQPFLGGQGPAAAYVMSLSEERRESLRLRIESSLPIGSNGEINLTARAWAVSGRVP